MSYTSITDPEVLAFIVKTEAAYPADSNQASVEENRRCYEKMCDEFRVPRPEGLSVADSSVSAVRIRTYCPTRANSDVLIMYFHGGGFVVGSLDSHDEICAEIADSVGAKVIAVDYRLAPEFKYPAQLDDVASVWGSLTESGQPGIVVGDSAGGTLCAALCLRAQRVGLPKPLAQVLIYPWLGGDTSLKSYVEHAEAPLLRTSDMESYTQLISNNQTNLAETEPELFPLLAKDFSCFPKSLIVTADVDPIRDDGVEFHKKLVQAGVESLHRNELQLVHGFIRARHMSRRAKESIEAVVQFLADVLKSAT